MRDGDMNGRELIEGSALGPEALKILFQAFDEAWAAIADNFGNNPLAIEAARARLADIILSIAHDDISDPAAIKNAALRVWSLG